MKRIPGPREKGLKSQVSRESLQSASAPVLEKNLNNSDQSGELDLECPLTRTWLNWLESTIAREDSRLGRAGAVCPCVPTAMRLSSIKLFKVQRSGHQIGDVVQSYGDRFLRDAPGLDSRRRRYFCIVLLVDPACFAAGGTTLEEVHYELKPWFIQRGMMLGEFHPDSKRTSVRSADLKPLTCPVSSFVIRSSSEHDLQFIEHDVRYTASQRDEMKRQIEELGCAI